MTPDERKEVWARIQEAFNGAKAAEIARKLGVSKQSVYKWQHGISEPTTEHLKKISHMRNRSVDWLLAGQPERLSDLAIRARDTRHEADEAERKMREAMPQALRRTPERIDVLNSGDDLNDASLRRRLAMANLAK